MGVLLCVLCGVFGLAALFLLLSAPNPAGRSRAGNALRVQLFAHRGLHGGEERIPENTLAAFENAVQAGTGIEMDVRLTRDGEAVIFHDETLKRLFGRADRVSDLTLDELCSLEMPGGFRVPTLEEALSAVRGRAPLIVEIKGRPFQKSAAAEKTLACLRDYPGAYCVESFDPVTLLYFRRHAPKVPRGQLLGAPPGISGRMISLFVGASLLMDFLSRPDCIIFDLRGRKSLLLRLMRRVFHPFSGAWAVRSEEELQRNETLCDFLIFDSFCPAIRRGHRATIDLVKENEP